MARDVLEVPDPVLLDEAAFHSALLQQAASLRASFAALGVDTARLQADLDAALATMGDAYQRHYGASRKARAMSDLAVQLAATTGGWFGLLADFLRLADHGADATVRQVTRAIRQKIPTERRRFAGNLAGLRAVMAAIQPHRGLFTKSPGLPAHLAQGDTLLQQMEARALALDAAVAEAHHAARALDAARRELRGRLRWLRSLWRAVHKMNPGLPPTTGFAHAHLAEVRREAEAKRAREAAAALASQAVDAPAPPPDEAHPPAAPDVPEP